jgi:hypothetical protein
MAMSSDILQVVHAQVNKFHEAFRGAKSLDEMIQLHDHQYAPKYLPNSVSHLISEIA